jgi:hypothetical protein
MKGFTKIVANNTYFILLIIVIDTMLALLYTKAKRNIEYTFTVTGLHINDFPTKKWNWSLFNNVIIKDGLLTIDFKNNKIQQILLPANYWEFEQKFNEFCKEQLNNQFN